MIVYILHLNFHIFFFKFTDLARTYNICYRFFCTYHLQYSQNEDHDSQYHHFMQIDGETMETMTDFIFLGSKITADGDCSHEVKRRLFLGRKAMANLDSILKSRDVTLPTRSIESKLWFFPIVMYECESWTIKRPECQRIDAFEL